MTRSGYHRLRMLPFCLLLCGVLLPSGVFGQSAAEFPQLYQQWSSALQRAQTIQQQFRTVTPAEQAQLRTEYQQLIQQLTQLEPQVIASAQAAYQANPQQAAQAGMLLFNVSQQATEMGDAEMAANLVQLLAKGGFSHPEFPQLRARIALASGDQQAALAAYRQVQQQQGLDSEGKKVMEELELREKEAQADDLPRVLMKTTKGDMVLELYENQAPNSVANFVSLVEKGYYDGLTFHRVLDGFMAQGGDPTGTGGGGPGYAIACECYRPDARLHLPGTLSMAHAGKDTGGSQFFITFTKTEHLDGRHTAFGRVIEGMEVLDQLQRIDPSRPNPNIQPDKIVSAKVLRKRDHAYQPKTLPSRR
ncbi:Putative peptidyl-prolyl cis-trans isomerase [Planctomycetales bacterium 10988]|nr:Putative peptidyl-prolyl cis-trans isomerase [Planctomycetales bacterium 10988]